jgi:AcrR family transcriptional regulator
MGRRAGVTSEQTKEDLLRAAATVFARSGYEGATIAEIATEAGLSTGAIYAHYDGKADLFYEVLRRHVERRLADRWQGDRPFDIGDLLVEAGADLERRPVVEGTLLIEAIMTAKHDRKTREVMSKWFTDQHEFFSSSLAAAQESGAVTADFSPMAAARFATTVMLGSLVLDVLDAPSVAAEDWASFIAQVVDRFRAEPASGKRRRSATTPARSSQ